jgi:putative acetyltransferase
MSAQLTIRPATNEDGEAVRSLVFAILVEYNLDPDPLVTDSDLFAIEARYVEAGGSFDVLVDGNGEVVGSVGLMKLDEERCELRKMYLASEHRGHGHGRQLLDNAIRRAKELRFKRIELETTTVLTTAIRLYEAYGFKTFEPEVWHCPHTRADLAYYLDL